MATDIEPLAVAPAATKPRSLRLRMFLLVLAGLILGAIIGHNVNVYWGTNIGVTWGHVGGVEIWGHPGFFGADAD